AGEPLPFSVQYEELAVDRPRTIGGVRVVPFGVPHASELVCIGFRLEVAGRTILYSGDSAWTDEFVARSRDVDLFICECTTYETRVPIHLSYPELAARVRDLGCRRLVLSHLGREPLAPASQVTREVARAGMTIDL